MDRPVVGRVRRIVRRLLDRVRPGGGRTVLEGPAAGMRIGDRYASGHYATGRNELPVQEAVAGLLRPGDTFLDVGANVGFFSLLAARAVGPDGRVVAFEVVPEIAEALAANVRLNGLDNVEVRTQAVGAGSGQARLRRTRHPGGATIADGADAPDVVDVHEVAVVAIDGLIADGDLGVPDVVKIDVEGHEEAVVEGMGTLIERRHPALVIELDAALEAPLLERLEAFEQRLADAGYRTRRLAPSYPDDDWAVVHLVAEAP